MTLYEQVMDRRRDAGRGPMSKQDWDLYVAAARWLCWTNLSRYLSDAEIADFAVHNTSIKELEELFEGARHDEEALQKLANGTEQ